jgi:hypothetical protein
MNNPSLLVGFTMLLGLEPGHTCDLIVCTMGCNNPLAYWQHHALWLTGNIITLWRTTTGHPE